MMRHLRNALCTVLGLLCLASCGGSGKKMLPNISGKAGEVLVVISQELWDGEVGDSLRATLGADCPGLPQREPLFDLTNVSPSGFVDMFRVHRNIVIVNVSSSIPSADLGVTYRENIWAKPQCVVSVNAPDIEWALTLINDSASNIIEYISQAERQRVIDNTAKYCEKSLTNVVKEFTGGGLMVFPSGYGVKKKTDDFIWISYETTYTNQAILLFKYKGEGSAGDYEIDNVTSHTNEILKANVPGMTEGSYMTLSHFVKPSMRYCSYKGRNFAELRGLWDVENDYMGGPFVEHVFYSKGSNDIIAILGFVYAPKYDKRLYIRQVESFLYSFTWPEEE